VRHQCVPEQGT